jgi:hypothetical protein
MDTVWYDKMVTISNAALRSKFSRSTIDRRVNDGRLSYEVPLASWVTMVDIDEVNQIALDRKV